MGQQQLLLLVLGIVIVGLAVVVGIASFNDAKQKSDVDRFTGQGVEMAGELIAWYHKPTAQGGGGTNSASLASATVDDLGYTNSGSDTYAGLSRSGTTANGTVRYLVQDGTHPFFHIHPSPLASGDMRVEVYVFGPSSSCIVARSNQYGSSATWSDGASDGEAPATPAGCSW